MRGRSLIAQEAKPLALTREGANYQSCLRRRGCFAAKSTSRWPPPRRARKRPADRRVREHEAAGSQRRSFTVMRAPPAARSRRDSPVAGGERPGPGARGARTSRRHERPRRTRGSICTAALHRQSSLEVRSFRITRASRRRSGRADPDCGYFSAPRDRAPVHPRDSDSPPMMKGGNSPAHTPARSAGSARRDAGAARADRAGSEPGCSMKPSSSASRKTARVATLVPARRARRARRYLRSHRGDGSTARAAPRWGPRGACGLPRSARDAARSTARSGQPRDEQEGAGRPGGQRPLPGTAERVRGVQGSTWGPIAASCRATPEKHPKPCDVRSAYGDGAALTLAGGPPRSDPSHERAGQRLDRSHRHPVDAACSRARRASGRAAAGSCVRNASDEVGAA